MAKTKEQKKKIIEELRENIDKQKSMVFVAFEGLKTSDIFNLRKKLKKEDCLLQVAKKTFLKIALKEQCPELQGEIGLIFGFKDEIMPAKVAYNFSRENENLRILGGFFENEFKQAEEVINLAQIPSREELLSKLIRNISSPIFGLANVLEANTRSLLNVLAKAKT